MTIVPTDIQYKRATGWVLHTQDQRRTKNSESCVARALLITNNFRDGHKVVKQLLTILNVLNVTAIMRVVYSRSLHSCSAGHCSGMVYVAVVVVSVI
jgi:hypothetical protein